MNIIKSLKQIFFNGLLFLLPITITFALLNFLFNLIINLLKPIKILNIPHLSKIPYYEIIIVLLFILFVGIILKTFIAKPLLGFIENFFKKIPFLKTVYFGAKQFILALTSQDQLNFKSIVLVEFPLKNVYSVGFLTGQVPQEMSPDKNIAYFKVFVPHTPNPTTGFFIILQKNQIIEIDLTRQEAMSLIISGGILQPERYAKDKTTEQ